MMQVTLDEQDAKWILERSKYGYTSLGERRGYVVVPVYKGRLARKVLTAYFGLPNASPTDEEVERLGAAALFRTQRSLFVDDTKDGEAIALWSGEE